MMYIRRINRSFILLFGFIWILGGMYTIIFASGYTQHTDKIHTDDDPPVFVDTVALPAFVPGTSLVAERIVNYDGYFVEDGSEEYVTGVAALYLHNSGRTMVTSCRVIVHLESGFYRFDATCIPPGATVLVQEEGRRPYYNIAVLAVGGSATKGTYENRNIEVSAEGYLGGLRLQNNTEYDYENIEIAHKNYDPESNTYIGGVTYVTYTCNINRGEQKEIWPVHFDGNSRIVYINGNEAQR